MSEPRYCDVKGQFCYCHDYGPRCEDGDDSTPFSRSRAALPENIRKTLEASNLPIEVATAIADLCEEKPEAMRRDQYEAVKFAAKHFESYGMSHLQFGHPWTGVSLAAALASLLNSTADAKEQTHER